MGSHVLGLGLSAHAAGGQPDMLLLLLQAEGTRLAIQPWELERHVTTTKH